jgi:nicotinate-nucleotide adenylyltransferase
MTGLSERIGVYGGTFDPMHLGHLAIAEEARVTLGLQRVLVVPAARQPLKHASQGAAPEQRLAMARLACADNNAFEVSDLELRRPPPSYTVETLAALRHTFGPRPELWLILGADAALELPRWHQLERICQLARLAILARPGYRLDLPALERELPMLAGRCQQIDGPLLEISSSHLRRRLRLGLPVRYQVPEAVRAFIEQHGLYVDEHPAPTTAG